VPSGASITSATLSFYKYAGPDGVFKASRLLKSFNEGQVTWNVAASGTSWTTPGALSAGNDYVSTADGQASIGDAGANNCTSAPYPAACWLNINVTSGVQAFAANPASNYGWKIAQVSSSGAFVYKNFNSRENSGFPSLRPKLTITYDTPPQPGCNSGALRPYDGSPINGNPIQIGSSEKIFEAEHFNCGGQNVAYHDNVAGNAGGQFRTSEDVDIIVSTDSMGGGYVVNNFETGEWLTYTINVAAAGNYDIAVRASNNLGPAQFHIEIGPDNKGVIPVSQTGSWDTFQWFTLSNVSLAAGQQVLKLVADQQYANVNQLRIVPAGGGGGGTAAYSCDFEQTYCDFIEQSKLGDAPPDARRSSIVAGGRSGSWAVRLHTEPGDDNVHGSGTWERDDLSKSPAADYCNEGQEEWWAWSIMFPSDYVFPPGPESGIILDFHHNSGSGLANFEIATVAGAGLELRLHAGNLNDEVLRQAIPDPYGATTGVTRNQWYDFVIHVKWTSGAGGFTDMWLNDAHVVHYTGPTLYTGISCYFKLANYHAPFGQPSSIIYDRVLRGASSADVVLPGHTLQP
jgi:hypothetical protein